MKRWLIDTSAWARRDQPAVAAELRGVLESGDVLAVSPPVLLELLRGPQGADVSSERTELEHAMSVAPVNSETFRLAADAMASLAGDSPQSHRKPIADLITAAVAHQGGFGVVHCDEDFSEIASRTELDFPEIAVPVKTQPSNPAAARQRALKRELADQLQRLPVADAEQLLEETVAKAKAQRGH